MDNLLLEAQEQYSDRFDSDIDLLELNVHEDGESGSFLTQEGTVYDFAYCMDSDSIIAVKNDSESDFYQDFATGYLASIGIPESVHRGDSYSFMMGLDDIRLDKAGQAQCDPKRGWKRAGNKCVRVKGGGKLKQGGLGRAAALTAGAAGLGAAALLGGTKAGREAVGRSGQAVGKAGKDIRGAASRVVSGDLKGAAARGGAAAKRVGQAAGELGGGVVGGAKEAGRRGKIAAKRGSRKVKKAAGSAKAKAQELGASLREKGGQFVEGVKQKASDLRQGLSDKLKPQKAKKKEK